MRSTTLEPFSDQVALENGSRLLICHAIFSPNRPGGFAAQFDI
jgi:hypothetical protein